MRLETGYSQKLDPRAQSHLKCTMVDDCENRRQVFSLGGLPFEATPIRQLRLEEKIAAAMFPKTLAYFSDIRFVAGCSIGQAGTVLVNEERGI